MRKLQQNSMKNSHVLFAHLLQMLTSYVTTVPFSKQELNSLTKESTDFIQILSHPSNVFFSAKGPIPDPALYLLIASWFISL